MIGRSLKSSCRPNTHTLRQLRRFTGPDHSAYCARMARQSYRIISCNQDFLAIIFSLRFADHYSPARFCPTVLIISILILAPFRTSLHTLWYSVHQSSAVLGGRWICCMNSTVAIRCISVHGRVISSVIGRYLLAKMTTLFGAF